jgi:DNA-binding LacI/PurR family transcriptional regulator
MARRVTSFEVARRAGVSRSAVSRCFTDGASIAPETRHRVMEAATALGYRPNAIARSLITSRSRMIAVVMGHLANPFYPDLLARLSAVLQQRGYRLLLFTGAPDASADPLVAQILPYQVDGIVLASTTLSSGLADECAAAGIPVVLINRTADRAHVSSVASANLDGGRLVARFLLAGGHERFGYIAGTEASSTNRDRERGYRAALTEAGAGPVARAVGAYSQEGARAAARALLRARPRPDALFCANDHMAIAVMDVARHELGLRVPDDLSVVGFDDAPPAAWASYGLTTVEQPVAPMVDAAVDILLGQIEGKERPAHHVALAGALVVRDSARRPAFGLVRDDDRTIWAPEAGASPAGEGRTHE